jgi:hypothetical protein
LNAIPHLTVAQVHDALSYYYDHSAEVEAHIQTHSEEAWQGRELPNVRRQKSHD